MHKYFIKTPWLARKLFPEFTWKVNTEENDIYLSFDDGPHPEITPWVLDQLRKYDAKGSFFCIGNNVKKYPEIYKRVIDEGHEIGNHTWSHMNGWKASRNTYLEDIQKATGYIQSSLFRPPYGRIRRGQAAGVAEAMQNPKSKVIMWDVLSGDFDKNFSAQQCIDNVLSNYVRGSIVVFHDSEKAFMNLKETLPVVLEHLRMERFNCKKLQVDIL